MSDILAYDVETAGDRKARRQRAIDRMKGKRGAELTEAEKQLLQTIREIGFDVQNRTLIDPAGRPYPHQRTVVKCAPSWLYSIDRA